MDTKAAGMYILCTEGQSASPANMMTCLAICDYGGQYRDRRYGLGFFSSCKVRRKQMPNKTDTLASRPILEERRA